MKSLIIIKGQLRTWDYNKENIRDFIESVVKNTYLINNDEEFFTNQKVDVLLSCWDISYQLYPDPNEISYLQKEKNNFTEDIEFLNKSEVIDKVYIAQHSMFQAREFFQNLNFELEEEYHLQCYLTYKTSLYKRQLEHQNNSEYDFVLEIRPDVFYENKFANKKIKFPGFGEILSLNGNFTMNFFGIISAVAGDLIFCMNGKTHNIYSKELLFHYNRFLNNTYYSNAHVEKNLFFSANNLQVNDLRHAFCNAATVVRPNIDLVKLKSSNSKQDTVDHINYCDQQWRQTKEETILKKISLGADYLMEEAARLKDENNLKIKNLLMS